MGSPETCPTCKSKPGYRSGPFCLGSHPDKWHETHRDPTPTGRIYPDCTCAWKVPDVRCPWHGNATPTPPGAAPDAASGPKAPPRMPAPADDALTELRHAHDADTGNAHWSARWCRAYDAIENVVRGKQTRPAPDAGAAERAVVDAAVAEHTTRYGPDGDYKVAASDAEQRTEDAVRELLTIRAALRGTKGA